LTLATTGIVNLVLWTYQQTLEWRKKVSPWMVKQVLKSAKYTWRRVRRSLKSQRDEGLFEFFQTELTHLYAEAEKGFIRLWFYDESGFNLNPNAVYAWLPPHEDAKELFLPAQRGSVMTLAGFLGYDNTLEAYSQKGAMTSESFIAFTEDFITHHISESTVKNIVVFDNASFHTSKIVKQKMAQWRKKNLFFQSLPAYSSELNRIEMLWKMMKHHRLEIKDYQSAQSLEVAVIKIIKNFGLKYSISFS
jgi:transposase